MVVDAWVVVVYDGGGGGRNEKGKGMAVGEIQGFWRLNFQNP